MIDIENYYSMVSDVCDIFNISDEYLYEKISTWEEKSEDNQCFNLDIFREECIKFISSNQTHTVNDIRFCHIARHIEVPTMLNPLPQLLTSTNSLTKFLSKNRIQFEFINNQILINYKGEPIPTTKIYDRNRFSNNHCRLARRLGYLSMKDYCINGFMFAIELENEDNSYYNYLKDGPELLQDLDNFLNTNLSSSFCEESIYYASIIEVPLSEIVFDINDNLTNKEKELEYLYRCIYFIHEYRQNLNSKFCIRFNNQILRLSDEKSISPHHVIEI